MRGRLYHLDNDWYEWRQQPPLAAEVQVRVARHETGRVGLAELRVVGEPTSDLLRSIPIGRIEAAANAQLTIVDDRISALATRRRRGVDAGRPPTDLGGYEPVRPDTERPARGRPDRFYAEIAESYRELAQSSPRPAVDLATRHGVPVTTAHRWVKEARRRGYLTPGRPGKAG